MSNKLFNLLTHNNNNNNNIIMSFITKKVVKVRWRKSTKQIMLGIEYQRDLYPGGRAVWLGFLIGYIVITWEVKE